MMNSQVQREKHDECADLTVIQVKEITVDTFVKENSSGSQNVKGPANQLKTKPLVLHKSSDGTFCCPSCNKTFASRSSMLRHYRNHTGEHPYVCSFCQRSFASKAGVDAHQLRAHNLNTDSALSCSECGKLFIRRCALEVHLKIHNADKPFHCEKCGQSFTQKVSRDIHVAKHTGKYDYQCSICQKAYASQAKLNSHNLVHKSLRFTCELCGHGFGRSDTLAVHQRTHSEECSFQCSVCPRTFTSQPRLLSHSQMHSLEHQYRCTSCSAQFKQKTGLVAHLRRQHNIKTSASGLDTQADQGAEHTTKSFTSSISAAEQPGQTQSPVSGTFQRKNVLCPHCGKEFCKKQSLEEHQCAHNVSLGSKPQSHTCHLCTKSFVQKSKLTAHIRTHLQEPHHECNICGRRFHRKDIYNHHMFLHSKEKPFSCAHCGKTFASKFNLRSHLSTHSTSSRINQPVFEIQCKDCGKKFKHKKTFELHRKAHSGNFAYTCVTCSKKFMKKSHFEGHLRSHATDRPFQCPTCGRRFKEHKHSQEHTRKAHPSTLSLASLFATITNEDAQMDHMADILCPTASETSQEHEDSSALNVSGLPDPLQPTLVEVSSAAASTNMDTNYLLSPQVNLNETSISMSTLMPNLVFSTLEPMLQEIQISSTTQFLLTSSQPSLQKSASHLLNVSESAMSLIITSGEDTSSVLSQ